MKNIKGEITALLNRLTNKFIAWPGKIELAKFGIAIASIGFVFFQLRANNETNKVELRGQLYDRQMRLAADMGAGDAVSTVWALTSQQVSTDQVAPTFLRLVTTDPMALNVKNPAELYHSVRFFYPEMTKKDWPNVLPDY